MSDCLFCKIISGEIPADIVFESDDAIAFRDINPQAPTHVLIIPRQHISTINDIDAEHEMMVGRLFSAAREIAAQEGLSEENWAMIKEHRAGLYYVLKDLDGIAEYMLQRPLPNDIRATLIAAEEILPMVKAEEVQTWKDCLKSFGKAPRHRYVLAKGAGHKVWKKKPEIVIKEIARLYRKLNGKNK